VRALGESRLRAIKRARNEVALQPELKGEGQGSKARYRSKAVSPLFPTHASLLPRWLQCATAMARRKKGADESLTGRI